MDRRRVPTHAHDALDTLRRAIAASNGEYNGILTRKARTVLADEEELPEVGIDNVLEVLHNYGEIYYVGEDLRVTEIELSGTDDQSNSE